MQQKLFPITHMSFTVVGQAYNCIIFIFFFMFSSVLGQPSMILLLALNQLATDGFKSVKRGVKKYTHTSLGLLEQQKKEFLKLVHPDPSFSHFYRNEI